MTIKTMLLATAVAVLPALASAHMVIEDAYARASSPIAQTGATFLTLFNHNDFDDRLIGASSDAAERLELHTHIEGENGILRMTEVEGGFPVAAGERIHLERGGMHIMMLGLTAPLVQGEEIEVTFTFEHSDPVTQTIVIDNARQPGDGDHGSHGDHGGHGESDADGDGDGHDHADH
jgi:hypothetical protein